MPRVLFLCTGNYYRSRFSEAFFNFHAARLGLGARAFSRGLAVHLVSDFPDHISPHTENALRRRGIPLSCTAPRPRRLENKDLAVSAHIIALKESEHRDMLRHQFPGWESRVTFWDVHDLDASTPETQLPRIEEKILTLLTHPAFHQP